MSEQPTERTASPLQTPDPERLEQLQDYCAALRTIRAARGVFLLILILSLLVHAAAYSAARWGNVLKPLEQVQAQLAAPSSGPAGRIALDAETVATFSKWYYLIEIILPLAEFLGQVSCALLTLCFLFAALVCLSGGLGGVRGSIAAFFWTLVLLALLFPWGRWLGAAVGTQQVPGVYYTFAELRSLPTEFHQRLDEALHYVRFLGYPLLALLVALTGDGRFARGYRLVQRHVESRLKLSRI